MGGDSHPFPPFLRSERFASEGLGRIADDFQTHFLFMVMLYPTTKLHPERKGTNVSDEMGKPVLFKCVWRDRMGNTEVMTGIILVPDPTNPLQMKPIMEGEEHDEEKKATTHSPAK